MCFPIQEYGDTISGVVKEFLQQMSNGVPHSGMGADAVYFDMYHSMMIFYEKKMAIWLHTLPLLIAGFAWFIQSLKYGILHGVKSMQLKWAVSGMCQALGSFALALGLPMLLGALWALLTGKKSRGAQCCWTIQVVSKADEHVHRKACQ